MIAQTIKGWLQKLFAWWPWKKANPPEVQQIDRLTTRTVPSETIFWPGWGDGMTPSATSLPRLSTLENHGEWTLPPRSEIVNLSLQPTPISATHTEQEVVIDAELSPHTPSTRQRLEFLRYLVERGIVNEGFE